MIYHHQDLIKLFNDLFLESEQTELCGGYDEPLYIPQSDTQLLNQIIFRQDYYSSALHEIAHWCIASKERRKLVDYGYWYKPDGRIAAEQQLFEEVEAKPQALEWTFSVAAGIKFRVSADNLGANPEISASFKLKIYENMMKYLQNGLPKRAEQFKNALLKFYQPTPQMNASQFKLEYL